MASRLRREKDESNGVVTRFVSGFHIISLMHWINLILLQIAATLSLPDPQRARTFFNQLMTVRRIDRFPGESAEMRHHSFTVIAAQEMRNASERE